LGLDNLWTKNSWKSKLIKQIPNYPNIYELTKVENELENKAPIIFAGECENLKENLAKITNGEGFLLMGGDCAETFKDFNVNKVRDTYRLLLQMGLILSFGSGVPITKIGRIAGQFAKPRSDEYENINGTNILTYRGDIINGYEPDLNIRTPDPNRMLTAYYQSVQTLNILRAFSSGGYADISRVHSWNLDFVEKTLEGSKYRNLANKVDKSLQFIKAIGFNINDEKLKQTVFYTGHECLLLNYETPLTRQDSITNKWYDCSTHLPWLGERTRELNGAHVEYLRGINNPIGIKISDKCESEYLIKLIKTLNPHNTAGKIIIISRMGSKLSIVLPKLIRAIQNEALNVVWCCDPMHANTIKTKSNIKTRLFASIKQEINDFFDIHRKMGSYPGGIHLELTCEDVTECIGGEIENISEVDLDKNYLSNCDPRLNSIQSLELAFLIAEKMKNLINFQKGF
jgi:3-deoxy-7-phosphoheptulonate synthase